MGVIIQRRRKEFLKSREIICRVIFVVYVKVGKQFGHVDESLLSRIEVRDIYVRARVPRGRINAFFTIRFRRDIYRYRWPLITIEPRLNQERI